jgi:hypothetical protein
MSADYEDFRNTATATYDENGVTVTRTILVRAVDEIGALGNANAPARGDALAVGSGFIYCNSVSASPIEDAAGDSSQNLLYAVTATYAPLTNTPTVNKARWSISFRPQSYTLRNVATIAKQARYGPVAGSGDPAYPEVTTGINVTEEGAQGVEVDEMVEVLTIDFWKSPSDVSTYLDAVRPIVDTVNQAAFTGPWGTYAAGEARITGLTVTSTSGEYSTVSIEISRSKNAASISTYLDSIAGNVTYAKDGWEYAWVRYLKGNVAGDADVRPLSIDAFVATVYEEGDYTALGVSSGIWA